MQITSYPTFCVRYVAFELDEGGVVKESNYQRKLIDKLRTIFPGCFIVKNDPAVNQGVPDILILHKKNWAMLEVKRSTRASRRPNQGHHVDAFNQMSFAAFIHPDNETQVLNDLQSALGSGRKTRLS